MSEIPLRSNVSPHSFVARQPGCRFSYLQGFILAEAQGSNSFQTLSLMKAEELLEKSPRTWQLAEMPLIVVPSEARDLLFVKIQSKEQIPRRCPLRNDKLDLVFQQALKTENLELTT